MAKREGLSLVWLESFVRVAENDKRTAAAAEMGINQGTVTKDVHDLEQWLRRILVVDGSVPRRLTTDGEEFLPVARQVLQLLNAARQRPDTVETPPAPRVSVKDLTVPGRGPAPKDR